MVGRADRRRFVQKPSVVKLGVTKRVTEYFSYTYLQLYSRITNTLRECKAISGSPLISDDVSLLLFIFRYFPSAEIEHEVFRKQSDIRARLTLYRMYYCIQGDSPI